MTCVVLHDGDKIINYRDTTSELREFMQERGQGEQGREWSGDIETEKGTGALMALPVGTDFRLRAKLQQ